MDVSWTIKKAECFRIVSLELWCWKDSWESLDCKEIYPVNPKGNQSCIFIGRTDVEVETPIHWPSDVKKWLIWIDFDAGKDWWQEKGTREDEMLEGISGSMDLNLSNLWELVMDREVWRCCSPWGHKESDSTEWTELMKVTNLRARSLVLSAAEWKISDWYKTHSSLPRSF